MRQIRELLGPQTSQAPGTVCKVILPFYRVGDRGPGETVR